MRVCAAPPFATHAALACDMRWRPHDLLKLRRLQSFDDEPAWVRKAFACAPFAVVRRAEAADRFVAIGLRGETRAERYGTWAHADDIEHAIAPEQLAKVAPSNERRMLPAFVALEALRRDMSPLEAFALGPTGSVGFELATGRPTVTASSDLDLLIRTPGNVTRETAVALLERMQALAEREGVRIDIQLETPAGGVSLAELAAGKARVMARHAQGPRLVADPWLTAESSADSNRP
jgi:phosphoribosyl-dephospho-CoA transferase